MPAAEGWFWRLEDGSIHTRFDVDEELIAAEMARLADALDGERDAVAYIDSLRSHYRGADFQLGILDLVDYLGLTPVATDFYEQLGYFADTDDRGSAETAAALDRCLKAMQEWHVEADGFLAALEREFQMLMPDVMRWEIPVEDMIAATPVPNPCVELIESTGPASTDGTGVRAGLDVRRAEGVTIVDVWFDDGRFTPPRERTALTLFLDPETTVEPPSDRSPETLFSRLNTFLVTIDECGELPWIYSDFMAMNTYNAPLSSGYSGPTILDSHWLCDERVPEPR